MRWFILFAVILGCEQQPIGDAVLPDGIYYKPPVVEMISERQGRKCKSVWQCLSPLRQDCVEGYCETAEAWAHGFLIAELNGKRQYLEQSYKGFVDYPNGNSISLDLGSFANTSRLQVHIPSIVEGRHNSDYVDLNLGEVITEEVNTVYTNNQTIVTVFDKKHGYIYGKLQDTFGRTVYLQITYGIR